MPPEPLGSGHDRARTAAATLGPAAAVRRASAALRCAAAGLRRGGVRPAAPRVRLTAAVRPTVGAQRGHRLGRPRPPVHLRIRLLGPLVIYLIYKDSSPFTRHHAAEALNLHITLTIATIVSIPLVFLFIGIPLVFAIIIGGIVFGIIAAMAASRREPYRYPLTIHFVS